MQVKSIDFMRVSPSNEAAVRRKNEVLMPLPLVLVRFMSNMFGEGGYELKQESGRRDAWSFDTTLCHYRVVVKSEDLAVVMAWPKGARYGRGNMSAIWKIRAGD